MVSPAFQNRCECGWQHLFGANILSGISALLAVKIAQKIVLINTIVFTHIPSNFPLMLVPLMPNLPLAITLFLLRHGDWFLAGNTTLQINPAWPQILAQIGQTMGACLFLFLTLFQ
ncbi:MAG: hypothetical protein L6461_19155 [Anaerolineae bacterium]|nr:hypothetical protein [Anaerolineae bacterium]